MTALWGHNRLRTCPQPRGGGAGPLDLLSRYVSPWFSPRTRSWFATNCVLETGLWHCHFCGSSPFLALVPVNRVGYITRINDTTLAAI
jgi:hypothetical protein